MRSAIEMMKWSSYSSNPEILRALKDKNDEVETQSFEILKQVRIIE